MLHALFAASGTSPLLLAWGMPGGAEWIMIAAFGLLFFGKRLPEVGRSLGKGIVEFKKGLKGVEDDLEDASNKPSPQIAHETPAGAKFDPYTGKPLADASDSDKANS